MRALYIAWKDVRYMLREKETVVWVFVMPLVFFFFIGTVTSGFGPGGGDGQDNVALALPADAGPLLDHLVRRLQAEDYNVVRPDADGLYVLGEDARYDFEDFRRRLTVPEGFSARVADGEPVELVFRRRDEGLGADFDELRVKRAAYTLLADVILANERRLAAEDRGFLAGLFGGEAEPVTPEQLSAALDEVAALPRSLTLEVRPAGRRKEIPSGMQQTIPGILVMFTMMLCLTSGATMLMAERRAGLLRRLASAPLSRLEVVAGKWGGKLALALVQLAFGMAAATFLPIFDMDWGGAFGAVAVVMVAWAGLCASLGLLMGTLARSEGQALAISITGTMVLAALGGCWWPIEITPDWMQTLAGFLPTGWAMDALHRLVSFGDAPAAVAPHLALIAGLGLALAVVSARRFRFV